MIYHRFRDKSMLIIAHRLATIKNCDQIIVMAHGQIVEQGTHEQLLAKKGEYHRLWEMQQGNIIDRETIVTEQEEEAVFCGDEMCYT